MLRIDRYIARILLQAIAVALFAFVGLTTVFALVEEIRHVDAAYAFPIAVQYVLYTVPRRIYELIPYVVFLGTLLGLGSLASHSELAVLRASGMSVARLFGAAALPAGCVLVAAMALGEWVAPAAEEAGETAKVQARLASPTIPMGGSSWYREGGLFMNVAALGEDGALIAVRQYEFDANRRLAWLRTAREALVTGVGTWRLEDVVESRLDRARVTVHRTPALDWQMQASPTLLSTRALVAPRKLALSDLSAQIDYMRRESIAAASYELAFWGKLLQPLATLALTGLALAFIIGPLREASMGSRLAVGILTGLSFKYLQDLFGPMTMVYHLPAALAVAIPIALCAAGAAWGIRRAN
jgi:lipopolysaccharide export system permease protein